MSKEIIYWTYCDKNIQIRADEPVSVYNNHFKKDMLSDVTKTNNPNNYARCPSMKDLLKNTFGLKSPFKYDLDIKNKMSYDFDQDFYDYFVYFRDDKSRLASYTLSWLFIPESNDLMMESLPAFMEDNSFTRTANFLPGQVNIGKYVRASDCAFHATNDIVKLDEGDIYSYMKFNTDKQVVFKRFNYCDEIEDVMGYAVNGIKKYRKNKFMPLSWYYKRQQMMKVKKRTLDLVYKNLLE